ncbi:MAG: hypothetical protein R3Y26_03005 [Rikenellaceae bacterium]
MGSSWIFLVIALVIFSINRNNKIKKSLEEVEVPNQDFDQNEEHESNRPLDMETISEMGSNREVDSEINSAKSKFFGNYESVESMMSSREKVVSQSLKTVEYTAMTVQERSQFAKEFDAKKAVIYAEIMTPKFKE